MDITRKVDPPASKVDTDGNFTHLLFLMQATAPMARMMRVATRPISTPRIGVTTNEGCTVAPANSDRKKPGRLQ